MCLSRNSLLLLFLLFTSCIYAQSILVPPQIDIKVDGEEKVHNIEFQQYPFTSEKIDLRLFKRKYPKLEAPDYIQIEAPDLSEFRTTTVLIGLMTEEKVDSNAVVIWLAGDYFSNAVTFFVDQLMDRSFLNDTPVLIKAGQKPKKVMIFSFGNKDYARELWLQVPRKKLRGLNLYGNKKLKIANQFSIGAHAGFGSGSLFYQYDNLEIGFPTWYTVNFSEKLIGLSTSYSFPKFRFGLRGSLQNHYYYTSYLNVRVDNPTFKVNANTGERVRIENVNVDRNQDIHSRNRLEWSIFGAYRIHLGESIELQPTLSWGKVTYTKGVYVADRREETETYDLPPSTVLEGGIQMEAAVGKHKAFFLGAFYTKTWWEPETYFQTLPFDNLEINFKAWKGRLGYRMAIFK